MGGCNRVGQVEVIHSGRVSSINGAGQGSCTRCVVQHSIEALGDRFIGANMVRTRVSRFQLTNILSTCR